MYVNQMQSAAVLAHGVEELAHIRRLLVGSYVDCMLLVHIKGN
jgi:hypothetical protein